MIDRVLGALATLLKLATGCCLVTAFFYICAATNSGVPMVGAVVAVVGIIGWISSAEKRQLGLSVLLFAVSFFIALGCEGLAV